MEPLTILVINGHPMLLREVVRFLEEQASRYTVSGAAFRAADALTLAAAHRPQAILLGLSSTPDPGLSLIAELRRIVPRARVVVMASLALAEYSCAARAAGADACIDKERLRTDLIPALTYADQYEATGVANGAL